MRYFLATYEILDGEHEHKGAVIFEAATPEEAYQLAETQEFEPETDDPKFYFSFAGDGLTACKNRGCTQISKSQVQFLERVGLAFRK